jgi:hypothetical protein
MEAPTHCPDPVICNTSRASLGSLVNPRSAHPVRGVLFLSDTPNARLGQNGRELACGLGLARLIENADQFCIDLLQPRGME